MAKKPQKKKKVKYVVKGRTSPVDAKDDEKKKNEDKYYWSRVITGILGAILGTAVFKLIGWAMFGFMMVLLLAFPFFLSFVVFKFPYVKGEWDWKQILKKGMAGFFFIFMLISTGIYTYQQEPLYRDQLQNPADTNAVFIDNGIAYVADGQNGLLVVNLSNGRSLMDKFETESPATNIVLEGNIAYLAENAKISILDIEDPSNVNLLSEYPTDGTIKDLFIKNSTLYLALGNQGLLILDTSLPGDASKIVTYTDNTSDVNDVYSIDETIYLSDSNNGLIILDASDFASISEISNFPTNGTAKALVVDEKNAYIADGSDGLKVIDIQDPVNPELIGNSSSVGECLDIFIENETAYIASGFSGIYKINISSVTNPEINSLMGHYDTIGYANDIFDYGSSIYICESKLGLTPINKASFPPSPVEQAANADISFGWNWVFTSLFAVGLLVVSIKKKRK